MFSRILKTILSNKIYIITAIIVVIVVSLGGWRLLSSKNNTSPATNGISTQPINSSGNRTSSTQAPTTSSSKSAPTTPSKSTAPATATPKTTSTKSSTSSQTSTSNTSSSPPPSSTYSCITSASNGHCPFPADSYIVGANSDPYVDQNVWNGGAGYQQTLYANSPADWYVTANANTNFGGILTYPNAGFDMTGAVDSFSSTTSSWNVTIPTDNTKVAGWAAYDLWFNNWNDEVMIQTDLTANSFYDCTGVATATFSGITWHMCQFGSERVWKPGTDDQHLINRTSGSVDILAILKYMENTSSLTDKLPANSTWTAGSFGFEIADTHGITETFRVNGFSWDAQ